MEQKGQKFTIIIWSRFVVIPCLFAVFTTNSFSQKLPPNKIAVKEVKQEILLLDLLKNIQQQTDYTFIFDEKLLKNKIFSYSKATRQQFNQFLLKEITRQTHLQFTPISEKTYAIKRKIRKYIKLSGYVKDKLGKALIGVNIAIKNQNKGVITDQNGYYEINVLKGKHLLSGSYVGYETIEKVIDVDGYEDIHLDLQFKKHLKLEEILVVGNRFLPKTLQETAVPVDIINQQSLLQANQQELSQVLQYETASFHSTHQNISDGTDHIDPISLKGLGPDQMLVLINGKRRHFSSLVNVNGTVGRGSVGTDLNAIPLAAIKKIEVLKDGAAALYGSDAIGGVINLELKDEVDKGQVVFNTSITSQGDGEQFAFSSNYGLKSFKSGFTNLTFYYQNRAAINRAGAYDGVIFGNSNDENVIKVKDFFEQTGFTGNRVMQVGNAAITNTGLFLNMGSQIGEHFEFYNHSNFNYRNGKANGFYRFPYQHAKQSGLYPMGFLPIIESNILDFSSVSGIRGIIDEWQIDFSNNTGQNSFDFEVHNSNNASLGLKSPTSASAGGFAYLQNLTNIDLIRKHLFDFPINLALGTEFRLEKYTQKAGEEASWQNYNATTNHKHVKEAGFQAFKGFKPENASKNYRYNIGFYGEIEGELTQKLLVAVAGRFENYADFGSNISWKIASRYRVSPKLTLRTTYNTGFRAPSLQQNYFSSNSLQFLPVDDEIAAIEVAHGNHTSPIVKRLGISALKPEISNNFSIGLATKIQEYLSFTIDAYHISIKDRIVLSGHIFPTAEDDLLKEILTSAGVERVQFFTNAINTKTRGIDARLNYEKSFSQSQLNLFVGLHANATKVHKHVSPTALLFTYEEALFSREEIARLEKGQPASKVLLSANYSWKKFAIDASATRFGSVQYIHPDDGATSNWVLNKYTNLYESRDQLFTAKWLIDIDCSAKLVQGLNLTLGINNIFNIYPDKHQHYANTHNGILPYSRRVQQFGIKGRTWLMKLHYQIGS